MPEGLTAIEINPASSPEMAAAVTLPSVRWARPPRQHGRWRRWSGERLFGKFETFGLDGLLLNLAGPAPGRPLTRELCLGIAKNGES